VIVVVIVVMLMLVCGVVAESRSLSMSRKNLRCRQCYSGQWPLWHDPPMLAFIIRRLLQSAAVMLAVAFVAFALFNFVGDPVASMLGQDATPEDRANLRRDLGLDEPFYRQFASFVGNAVQASSACRCARAQGVDAAQGADAGDARAVVHRRGPRAAVRHSDGRLHRAATNSWFSQCC
jgi:hypothetical protein